MATWEEVFISWSKGPGESERIKIENTESQIRDAISKSPKLANRSIRVFTQGSYRNNVNVRADSDVDIGIVCFDSYFADTIDTNIKEEVRKSFSASAARYTYLQFKSEIQEALVAKFGRDSVIPGKKAFHVKESRTRVDADVCAFFEHRRYSADNSYISGVEMRPDGNPPGIINWPEYHYQNGVAKNTITARRYKRTVRVLKKLCYTMADEGDSVAKKTPSFLIECLLWNAPDRLFTTGTYYDDLRSMIMYLYNEIKVLDSVKEWGEVSELKYLFRDSQPWTRESANAFLQAAWTRIGYK